mmetsp:Transcript_6917/g.10207  ORF Transcript_6917/g.10207 Transcript_6917/m.10207 type:complete len:240 (+) Transcript_6917:92-811(+)
MRSITPLSFPDQSTADTVACNLSEVLLLLPRHACMHALCIHSITLHGIFYIIFPKKLHEYKHKYSVPSTSSIIRKESIVQRQESLLGRDRTNSLQSRFVEKLTSLRIRLLVGHSIFGCFQGHGNNGIKQTGSHGSAEYIGHGVLLLTEKVGVHQFELIIGGHLKHTHHHSTLYKRRGSAPVGSYTLLLGNSSNCIEHALIIATLSSRQCRIVGHADTGDFHGTRHIGSHATRESPDAHP